ncbi:MAG TPA: TatD family hydrolase [Bacteroidales bacterium]|nr:TatD family hydrolase [Bacteroidales bacterium]
MNIPQPGDYIDIHVHGGKSSDGIFILETLMAHEDRLPEETQGAAFTYGIHPWFLTKENSKRQLELVKEITAEPGIVAIGEAGFDKLKGPSIELQSEIFNEQVKISEELHKPLIIHCVRAWDEVLDAAKKLKPKMPWMIHGYRGKIRQAEQLISKGFWLSVWFDFALRPESSELMKDIPADRFFLETDGADVSIKSIYEKVAADKGIVVDELKALLFSNYMKFFGITD